MPAVHVLYMYTVHTQTLNVFGDVLMAQDYNSLLCLSPDLILSPLFLDHYQRERGQPHEECPSPSILSSFGREGPQQEGKELRGQG